MLDVYKTMISIFAKRAFLNTSPNTSFESKEKNYHGRGHLQRVSSIIRGNQIAEKIGAKFNPESGYENDVCIYVKPHLKKGMDFKFEGKKAYIDIIDGANLGELALKHPEVGVITCSQADFELMTDELPNNEIVLIPQHHCNFDRLKRNSTSIKRIGVIGEENAFDHLPKKLDIELKKQNIELVKFSKFFSREDIIDFYMNIDLQIVWRPYKKILSNPLKIVNSASFGIPTIAYDEVAFQEVKGCYSPAFTLMDILLKVNLFKQSDFYKGFSERCLAKAEDYHIDKIAELYKELDK